MTFRHVLRVAKFPNGKNRNLNVSILVVDRPMVALISPQSHDHLLAIDFLDSATNRSPVSILGHGASRWPALSTRVMAFVVCCVWCRSRVDDVQDVALRDPIRWGRWLKFSGS